ncbi:hypothetical protein D7X33_47980, partial [Butyricicoccus sp. 1XD8-22]
MTTTRHQEPQTSTQYKYYKITRDDGYITYCNALNWLEEYFKTVFGLPSEWIESNEKATIQSNKYELDIPVRIEATANDDDFDIVLSKQEY